MSQPATEPPAGPPRGQGKKILGMRRGTAIGVGVVGLVVVVILVIRARNKSAAASSTTATTAGSCPDGSAPDANGNCPQASADFSGQLQTLESEIAALQGAMSSGAGGGGPAGSVGAATGTPTTTAPAPVTTPATTTPATSAAVKAAAGPISNLQATSVGSTTATVRWNAAQGATGGYSYQLTDTSTGSKRPAVPTRATSVNLTGLKPKTTYNFGVQGLPGGGGNNIHFTTK